jgi:BirA family biotin operon repressor/biotin-[acetyl-CoA-carboxylase] ligase
MSGSVPGAADLAPEVLGALMPRRPIRSYAGLLSTEADALGWARSGGPPGAVVTTGYQASPRGRGGIPWPTGTKASLGFSLLLRPNLTAQREGWLYLLCACAVGDVLGPAARYEWPDTVRTDAAIGRVAVQPDVVDDLVSWAVVSVLVHPVEPPRGPLLSRLVAALERRSGDGSDAVVEVSRRRCVTFGNHVRARIIPMGPRGVVIDGVAADLDDEGSLVLERDDGSLRPVRPQDLGRLEPVDAEAHA